MLIIIINKKTDERLGLSLKYQIRNYISPLKSCQWLKLSDVMNGFSSLLLPSFTSEGTL